MTATHTIPPVTPHAASEPGALPGWSATCTCGTRISSSLQCIAERDAWEHDEWHRRTGR